MSDTGRVAGKVVVVTGAARGQGAAEVEALAREGATVLAVDVLDDEGMALEARLTGDGLSISYRRLDVTSESDWAGLAAAIRREHGRVNALINNAGVAARDRLPHVNLDVWHRTMDINVTGPLLGIQALVPLMGSGASIVNVCSVAAVSGTRPRHTPRASGRCAG